MIASSSHHYCYICKVDFGTGESLCQVCRSLPFAVRKIHLQKHYQNARAHENCYCHKCDIIFDEEDDLDQVGYST